ncbi:DCC1-like thiol-disulfide oxidoreductase family protein [Flavobacterium turcicum]|uniref:DUF393 domain-containing protein n=1 Tax=Flavobacterium turcicum TaxID=2764718 RepID=A0ABR7JI47_9FLAO|nr:DCC1-like thiol-disulfide oxidoreductase family protein [Flavobacterium turcicum]MBC5864132.1 DUF393 domain-containing protein [Flavobacterium turcicum]NHL03038.1 DUF393 domain-containing protein [Flavobacterium turcicum]
MRTLTNQTLLYDKDCPLCRVYTSGFIKARMLDENGKKPYCQLSDEEQNFIDVNRASNEIALVDNENKTVIYGIDSLLKVIGFSFPWMERIGNLKPIKFFLKKLYSFISYNRKVIIPSKIKKEIKLQCVPDFNFKYRILYILFAMTITTFVLYNFSDSISILPNSTITRELILVFGQIVFQSLFLIKFDKKIILNYIGNLMTVSLMGSLLLLPILILNLVVNIPELINLGWFGTTVLLMLVEHSRRIKLLELPFFLSIAWVIYRLIALTIILNLN